MATCGLLSTCDVAVGQQGVMIAINGTSIRREGANRPLLDPCDQIGQDLLFFRLVEYLVIKTRIKMQRLVRRLCSPDKFLAGLDCRNTVGRAMKD